MYFYKEIIKHDLRVSCEYQHNDIWHFWQSQNSFFFLNQHVEKMATNSNIYYNFIVPVHSAHLGHRSRHEVSQTRFFVYSVTRHCGHYIKQQLKLNSDE